MIYTEEKAKVVAAACGIELLQFLAVLAILYQDDWKNSIKCTRMIVRIYRMKIILFFQLSWCKISCASKNFINVLPLQQQRRPLPSILYKSFFYDID